MEDFKFYILTALGFAIMLINAGQVLQLEYIIQEVTASDANTGAVVGMLVISILAVFGMLAMLAPAFGTLIKQWWKDE